MLTGGSKDRNWHLLSVTRNLHTIAVLFANLDLPTTGRRVACPFRTLSPSHRRHGSDGRWFWVVGWERDRDQGRATSAIVTLRAHALRTSICLHGDAHVSTGCP